MEESRLKSVALFGGASPKQLRLLSSVTDEVTLPAGTHLVEEGAFSYEFLLLTSGSVEVRQQGVVVARLGPDDFVGEIGAMRDARRNASVVATSNLTAIVMSARDLRRVVGEIPSVGARIEAAIAERSDSGSASRASA